MTESSSARLPESRRLNFSEVPVVDMAPLVAGVDDAVCVAELEHACRDVGFVYIVNHGIDAALVDDLAHEAKKFFACPDEQKESLLVDGTMRGFLPLGYRSYEGETRAGTSRQEGFWVGHDRAPTPAVPLDARNRWPTFAPSLKPAMERYFVAVEALSTVLMRAFALALGLAPDAISTLFKRPLSRLKLNHYPPQWDVRDEHHIGVVPHADSGGFTILWQDHHGGLEVATKDGHWVVAPPLDGAFVINLGNVMQIWTDGYFASTPHRVINRAGTDRYLIPFFVNPSHDASIGPLNGSAEAGPGYGDYQLDIWRHTFPIAYPAAAC